MQDHYAGIAKYADDVAERLLAVGVSGRPRDHDRANQPYPGISRRFADDAQIIQWFALYYRTVSDEIGQGIKATSDSDPTTSNLLQDVQHGIDKYQWQFRAMTQPTATDANTGADLNGGRLVAPVSAR